MPAPLHVVLVQPEIAGNTGNVIRLCANAGAVLHLVEPLGFTLDDARMRRAGLDYHEIAMLRVHSSWGACIDALGDGRRFAFTSRATRRYTEVAYAPGDALVFGAESVGLSRPVLDGFDDEHQLAIPMRPGNRSLNLANCVALTTYEAWRQWGFPGAAAAVGNAPSEQLDR